MQPSATSDGNWNNPNNWYVSSDYLTTATSSNQTGFIAPGYVQVFINSNVTQNTGSTAQADTLVVNGNSTFGIPINIANGATFNGGSNNGGNITNNGATYFDGTSTNSGTTTSAGVVTFNATSSNTGTIVTSATTTFNGNDASSTGIIRNSLGATSTPIQRIFTSSVATARNFLTEAGHNNWVIVAQNAVVDIKNAIFDVTKNIFKAILGGSFISNGAPSSVVPNISVSLGTATTSGAIVKWNPNINWDNSTTCEYSYDNFATTATTTCSTNNTILPKPLALTPLTLSLRGTNINHSYTEKAVPFTYDNTGAIFTSCGSNDLLDESRTYYLQGDVIGPCTITSSSATTTLQGNVSNTGTLYTVNGNVVGNGHNIKLQNIIVNGDTDSSGGNILLQNIISTATTTATGVTTGSTGGTIIVNSSNVGSIVSNGQSGTTGGNGGHITVGTSTTASIISLGGAGSGSGNGGAGGVINVWNSDGVAPNTPVTANGGDAICGTAGNGGIITLTNYTNYVAINEGGTATGNCGGHSGSHGTTPTVTPRPTPSSPTPSAPASHPSTSVAPVVVTPYNPLSQSISLPVQQLKPLVLTKLPVFGETGVKGSFSFIAP
ncbi:MAG: hypothetical protein WCF92_00765, partial [bacterium]